MAPTLGLVVPGPGKPGHEQSTERAISLGYRLITTQASLPYDLSAETKVAAYLDLFGNWVSEVVRAGATAIVRLPHDPNPSSSFWLAKGGGKAWDTPYDPPEGTWPAIASWHQRLRDLAARITTSLGQPHTRLAFELTREKGMGGVSGPCRGRWSALSPKYSEFKKLWAQYQSTKDPAVYDQAKELFLTIFPAECWSGEAPLPEGTVLPRSIKMLRAFRDRVSFGGVPTIALSFEADYDAEVLSFTGANAQALLAKCSRVHFHCYAGDAKRYWDPVKRVWRAATPDELAQKWAAAVLMRAQRVRKNPLITHPLAITEANVFAWNVPTGADVAQYRLALARKATTLENIGGVGLFCAVANDGASSGTNLYTLTEDDQLAAVGSTEVGPKILDATGVA